MKQALTLTKSIKLLLIVLFTTALLSNSRTSSAQVVFTEDFNYPIGDAITAHTWTSNSGGGTNPQKVVAGLTFSGSARSAIGGAVSMTTSGEDNYPVAFTPVTSGSVYTSFMLNVSAAQATGDYFVAVGIGSSSTYSLRFFAKSSGAGFVLGLNKNNGTTTYGATVYSFNTTYFVVLKYQFNTSSGTDDGVSYFINPTLGSTEPAATFSTTGTTADAASISGLVLRQGTAGSASTQVIDGITVGLTWADVTPFSSTATIGNIVTQPSGAIAQGSSQDILAGFTLRSTVTANFTGATVTTSGSAVSGDFTGNVEIFRDNNGDGLINGSDADVSGGGVPYSSSMAFTISGETGITTSRNYLIVAPVAGVGVSTNGHTVTATIASGAFATTGPTTNAGSVTGNSLTIGTPPPVITLNSTSTTNIAISSGFDYIVGNPAPPANSFTVSGASLVANVTVTPATTDYQVSTTSATAGFGSSATLTYNSGTGALTTNPQTVWVRLAPGLSASLSAYKNETINVTTTGAGANAPTVTASGVVYSGQFTSGNVVVEATSTANAANANPVFLYEFSNAGVLQNVFSFPASGTLPTSNPFNLTENGTGSTNAYLNLSSDGSLLTVPGYNAIPGSTPVGSATDNASTDVRVLGSINQAGTISTANTSNTIYNDATFRSLASNGFSYWTSGSTGINYFFDGSSTPVPLTVTNTRDISIYNGNIYFSSASTAGRGVYQLSTNGLPIGNVGNGTLLTDANYATSYGTNNTSQAPNQFAINPAGTIMYFTDDSTFLNSSHESGGIIRYNFVAGHWVYAYTHKCEAADTKGARGLTVDWNGGGNPIVYATVNDFTRLVKITDAGSATTGTVIATNPTGINFRGVALAPTTAPATPAVFATATSFNFGAKQVSTTSTEQAFNVSGYNLTGPLVVTPPAGYAIGTTSGGPYTFTNASPLSISGATVNQTIYLVFKPTAAANYYSNLQVSSTTVGVTTVSVPDSGVGVNTLDYYSNASGSLTTLGSWDTNTNGVGSNPPANFTTAGQVFHLVNRSTATLTSPWTISGAGAKLVVGNGSAAVNFTIPGSFAYTGTVDVTANATLTIQNSTLPTWGVLNIASTVVFNQTGTSIIPSIAFGNLTLLGSNPATDVRTFSTSSPATPTLIVNGNFTASGVSVLGAGTTPFTYMQLAGNFTGASGATFGSVSPSTQPVSILPLFGLITSGNGNQKFSYNGGTIEVRSFSSTKTAGTLTLDNGTTFLSHAGGTLAYSGTSAFISNTGSSFNSTGTTAYNLNFTGTASFTLGGNVNTSDNTSANYTSSAATPSADFLCNFGAGTTFSDGGKTIQVSGFLGMTGAGTYNLTGTVLISTRVNTSQIKGAAGTNVIVPQLNNLTINTFGGTEVDLEPAAGGATITLKGSLTIQNSNGGTAKLNLQGNTLNIGGSYSDNFTVDALINSANNKFVFNGTGVQTFSNSYTTGESMNNVVINNPAGVNFTAASVMDIITPGTLTLTSGVMNTSTGKVVLGAASTISENISSYVVGTVKTTRVLLPNTNETFGGMGIEVDALGNAPGNTVATRVIGVSSPFGCSSSSILRKFTLASSLNVGLNATVVFHYLGSVYELNGFNPSNVSLFESTNGGSSWTNLASTTNTGASTITIAGLDALGVIAAGTPQPMGGMITPINSIVCSGNSTTLTALGAVGSLNWQSSTDNVTWSNIGSATNTTYSATPSVKTYYRVLSTYPGCLIVSSTAGVVDISNPVVTVTAPNVTDNSVTLSWSPVGTGNYSISYSGTSSSTLTSVTPPKTITGLTSSGTYNFTITQTGAGLSGCPASGTLNGVNTLCGVPTGVTASSPAAGQLLVSWTGVPSANYRVYYRPLFSYTTYFTKDVTNASSVLLTKQGNNNIYSSGTYEIYVSRLDCPTPGITGEPSNFVYVTALPDVACATPVIDSVRSVCPVQVEVFIHHNPSVSNYNVYFQRETPTVFADNSYGISSDYFSITTPYSGQQYLIAIDAKCSANSVSSLYIWPGGVSIKPLCSSPNNVVLSNATCHGFTASWNADQCITNNASGYSISLRAVGSINFNSYNLGVPGNGLSPSEVINWLPSGKAYQAFVRTIYNCNGFLTDGPSSQIQTITTLSSGCRDEEDAPVAEETAPAVQQTSVDNTEVLSLYPNPNNGQFEINLSSLNTEDRQVRVEVMNMLGQTVATHFSTIEGGHYNEYVKLPSAISSGTYIVRITVGNNAYTSKINVSK